MTLYEPLACFASQPGHLVKSPDGISKSFRSFIDMNSKMNLKVKKVFEASDVGLVTTGGSFIEIWPDGNHVDMTAKSLQQPDGPWRFAIDIAGEQANLLVPIRVFYCNYDM